MANLLIQAAVTVALGAAYRALTPDTVIKQEEGKLADSRISSASEGATIAQLWGRQRIAGQVMWATKFREQVDVESQSQGGGKGGGPDTVTETTSYRYFQSFAIGLCEANGARIRIGRIWADGLELDQSTATIRFYDGSETQSPDSAMVAIEGDAPAYRGLAYMVFDDFEVTPHGNRLPQITVEVTRSKDDDVDRIEQNLQAVCMIPASNEFIYGTRAYFTGSDEESKVENVSQVPDTPDFVVSLDQLADDVTNISSIELVVAWFGDDLRCGNCEIKPKVDFKEKVVKPVDWRVSNQTRATAELVTSTPEGKVAFGGTPADVTVREGLIEIKSRGHRAVFYPFIMMDVPATNSLPDPYSNNASSTGQSVYPWRGRVTCSPAAGFTGTVDKTAAAATQVSSFVGTVSPAAFGTWDGTQLPYSGPTEWSFRRMVLHYAHLCKDILSTGDAFIIGTEMVGMTSVRSSASNYPFVNALVTLLADVKTILPAGVKVSYAADWSEYHSHRPSDGSNDVYFNLDPLWAAADFIGIDNYLPLTDWRTADDYDYRLSTLMDGVEGGEYYDYFYASQADRTAGTTTPIFDGAYSKDWVFRQKDMRNWWTQPHYNRPGGVEAGSPTSFPTSSKPIWFTEFGCAAIDKGANQPNVFLDPKSSESFTPYFSTGARDDLIQRRYAEAWIKYWTLNSPAGMISPANMFAWTWDARPFPNYPYGDWGDRDNWRLGHWLNGRLNIMYLKDVVRDLASNVGLQDSDFDFTGLDKFPVIVRGHLSSAIKSPREVIEELGRLLHAGVLESEGVVKLYRKRLSPQVSLSVDDLVSTSQNPGGFEILTAQETDIPREVSITFANEANGFQSATATGKRQTGNSQLTEQVRSSTVLEPEEGRNIAEELLHEMSLGRQSFKGAFPRDVLKYDPGDMFEIVLRGRTTSFRIDEFTIGSEVKVEAVRADKTIYTPRSVVSPLPTTGTGLTQPGSALVEFIDIPLLTAASLRPWAPRLIAYQNPWPGSVVLYQDDGSGGFTKINRMRTPATIGSTTAAFTGAPGSRWDNDSVLRVKFFTGTTAIMSLTETSVLNGANTVAVKTTLGWELVQFKTATLVSANEYELTGLLRGQNGTEYAIESSLASGARVVFVNAAWDSLSMTQDEIGIEKDFRYGPSGVAVGDGRYTNITFTPSGRSLMPFSPVHLKRKTSGTDHVLTWIRRGRLNADSWDGTVPLNEDSEAYEVVIYDGATSVRTIQVAAATSVTYTAAQQTADFGSTQSRLKFIVYQISAAVGRGEGALYDDT